MKLRHTANFTLTVVLILGATIALLGQDPVEDRSDHAEGSEAAHHLDDRPHARGPPSFGADDDAASSGWRASNAGRSERRGGRRS